VRGGVQRRRERGRIQEVEPEKKDSKGGGELSADEKNQKVKEGAGKEGGIITVGGEPRVSKSQNSCSKGDIGETTKGVRARDAQWRIVQTAR